MTNVPLGQIWKRRWLRRMMFCAFVTTLLVAYFVVRLGGFIPDWSFVFIIAGYACAVLYVAEQTLIPPRIDGIGSRYPEGAEAHFAETLAQFDAMGIRFALASTIVVIIAYQLLLLPRGFVFDEAFMLLVIGPAPGALVQTLFFMNGGKLE